MAQERDEFAVWLPCVELNQQMHHPKRKQMAKQKQLPPSNRLPMEQQDEQPNKGQVNLGRLIDKSVVSHNQCSRVYHSRVSAIP